MSVALARRSGVRYQDWRDRAACRAEDPGLFFPAEHGSGDAAKAVCAACPVARQCLSHALSVPELSGVWGGLDQDELREMRRGTGRPPGPRMCGNGLHLMDEANTYTAPSTGRVSCRACSREWDRQARAERRYREAAA